MFSIPVCAVSKAKTSENKTKIIYYFDFGFYNLHVLKMFSLTAYCVKMTLNVLMTWP